MSKELDVFKELEALKIGIPKLKKLYENSAKKMSQNDILGFDLTFVYLDKALQRLESIENANPNEEFESLKKLGEYELKQGCLVEDLTVYDIVKQALLKSQEQEKVLKIINEKYVEVYILLKSKNVEQYNFNIRFGKKLTEEEFDTLKRWLE